MYFYFVHYMKYRQSIILVQKKSPDGCVIFPPKNEFRYQATPIELPKKFGAIYLRIKICNIFCLGKFFL